MMNKKFQLTFYTSELTQYNHILKNDDIKSHISLFLLKYVSLEAFYKKLLIAEKEKNGKKLKQGDKRHLKVISSEVRRVLSFFEIKYDDELIERIFGSNDNNYMDCSIKKLRDRLVHNANDNVLRVILERYNQINKDIDEFFALFVS